MARSFNGTTDQIDCGPNVGVPYIGGMTFSAWVNMSSLTPAYSCVIGRFFGLGGGAFFLFVKSTGALAIYVGSVSSGLLSMDPGNTIIATGAWHHLCGVWVSQQALSSYVDGAFDNSASLVGQNLETSYGNSHTTIGVDPNTAGRNLGGIIADVAVWSCPLYSSEIAGLGKGVFRPWQIKPKSLLLWCPLDGYEAPAFDRSGFGNNGVLTGTAFALGPPLLSPLPPFFVQQTTLKTPSQSAFLAAWALQRNTAIEGVAT